MIRRGDIIVFREYLYINIYNENNFINFHN